MAATEETVETATSPSRSEKIAWLDAFKDPVAGVKTHGACMALANIMGDNDHRLLIADYDCKLRVYKGTSYASEHALMDVPTAICCFYLQSETKDKSAVRAPAIAISAGPKIFVYRNLRPYLGFTLPPLEIDANEKAVWEDLKADKIDPHTGIQRLVTVRDAGVTLCAISNELIGLTDTTEQVAFVHANREASMVRTPVITCMGILHRDHDEDDDVGFLVVGTEAGQVMVIQTDATFKVVAKCNLPAIPALMSINGTWAVGHRITLACRDAKIYTVKKSELQGTIIELEAPAVAVAMLDDKVVMCALMNNAVHAYFTKGKKKFSMFMPVPVTEMTVLRRASSAQTALVIGLSNGEVRVYLEKALVSTINVDGPVTGLCFGSYAREDDCLAITTKSGAVNIKVLPWRAKLAAPPAGAAVPAEQDVKLNVPYKTKIYLDQTERERAVAADMYRTFQRELFRLRLSTARAFAKTLSDALVPTTATSTVSIKMNAQVMGIGPFFHIKLSVQNNGATALAGVPVVFAYNRSLYRMANSSFELPFLVPGLSYKLSAPVESIDDQGGAEPIRVLVCKPGSVLPLITVIVNMPLSELLFEGR